MRPKIGGMATGGGQRETPFQGGAHQGLDPVPRRRGQQGQPRLECAPCPGHQRDQRPPRAPGAGGKLGDLGGGHRIGNQGGQGESRVHRSKVGGDALWGKTGAKGQARLRVTAPVTPAQASCTSSSPSTRSGLVGGGITTASSLRKPKRS